MEVLGKKGHDYSNGGWSAPADAAEGLAFLLSGARTEVVKRSACHDSCAWNLYRLLVAVIGAVVILVIYNAIRRAA